jgi:peptidoglycan/xylan/chitin deacetylase (PgdA/CDA1 family)
MQTSDRGSRLPPHESFERVMRNRMTRNKSSRFATVMLALLGITVVLSGCAAGGPGLVTDAGPTQTAQQIAAAHAPTETATATATKTPAATATASPAPTDTPEPKPTISPKPKVRPTRTPEPGPTPRPDPPADDGSGMSQVYDHGTSGRPEVALTFDAGADRGYAEEILDTLAEYGVKASFGITGHWADENPDLVKRMVDEGHMIFNHTWSHRSFTGYSTSSWDEGVLSSDERATEITDTAEIISKIADGYDTAPYFRPPYGDLDDSVLADVATDGYWVTVMWTCDSLGWNGASVDQIIERCGTSATAGDIILMHVGAESLDAEALPALIETLQSEGLEMVTVEELLQP